MPLLETRGSGSALAYGLNSYNAFPMPIASGLQFYLDAYYTDSLSQNVHPNPTDIFGWSGTGNNNATISRDTIPSPVGNTPLKMVVTGSDPYVMTYSAPQWNLHPALSGETWTLSVYAKSDAPTTCELFILTGDTNGNYNNDGGAGTYNIDTNWQRISFTITLSQATTRYVQLRLDGPNSGGVGRSVWFDGVQLERGSTATTFNSKNGSTWYDLSGNNRNATRQTFPKISNFNSQNRTLTFDGSNRCIGSVSNITGNTSRTMSAWFKGTSNDRIPISLGTTSGGNEAFSMVPQTSNIINVYGLTGPYDETGIAAGKNILDGNWHNLVLTWNAGNPGVIGAWVDGVNSGNLTRSAGEAYNTSNGYIVGNWGNNDRYWVGDIAQVYGYNRVLSQSEIQYNFNIAKTRFGL